MNDFFSKKITLPHFSLLLVLGLNIFSVFHSFRFSLFAFLGLISTLAILAIPVLLFFREKIPVQKIIGLILVIAGAYLTLSKWSGFLRNITFISGDFLGFCITGLYSLFYPLILLFTGLRLYFENKAIKIVHIIVCILGLLGCYCAIAGLFVGRTTLGDVIAPLLNVLGFGFLPKMEFGQNRKENIKLTVVAVWIAIVLICRFSGILSGSFGSGGGGNTSKCTICGQPATHTFQGSGYCTEHYKDAIIWAADNVWNR